MPSRHFHAACVVKLETRIQYRPTLAAKHRYRSCPVLFADKLATSASFGSDFCDWNFEAFKPRLRFVEINDGSTVPLRRDPIKLSTNLQIPQEEQFEWQKYLASPKMKIIRRVRLDTSTNTWVEVSTKRWGTFLIEQYHALYIILRCHSWIYISNVEPRTPLTYPFCEFWRPIRRRTITPRGFQPYITRLQSYRIINNSCRGLGSHTRLDDTKFRKRHTNAHDKRFAHQRELHMGLDENLVTPHDFYLHVPSAKEESVRNMLRKKK